MCSHMISWMPKAQTTGIRTIQVQEFDNEDGLEARAQELVSEGATEIRRWDFGGTFVVKVDTYWTL